ncbi:hypothetical protein [Kineosporia succinea]|uniref:Uncharacterized protein n=1 Tax=Kineosporia succinea TaxID=84632 RepID=A0ABT9NVZ7_9ACTN|nr:hypothetical protein [Kineosporia succinea]MDP9824599.1 hypothetical protein [Kineosporia succinea]
MPNADTFLAGAVPLREPDVRARATTSSVITPATGALTTPVCHAFAVTTPTAGEANASVTTPSLITRRPPEVAPGGCGNDRRNPRLNGLPHRIPGMVVCPEPRAEDVVCHQ